MGSRRPPAPPVKPLTYAGVGRVREPRDLLHPGLDTLQPSDVVTGVSLLSEQFHLPVRSHCLFDKVLRTLFDRAPYVGSDLTFQGVFDAAGGAEKRANAVPELLLPFRSGHLVQKVSGFVQLCE